MKNSVTALCGLVALLATPVQAAGDWSLVGNDSQVAFASIKKDTVGEVHHFGDLSGSVDGEGNVVVEIDVASVETWIDIRNERIQKMVLNAAPVVTLKATVDAAELEAMETGDTDLVDVSGVLSLNGVEMEIDTTLFIARLGEDRMMAVTDEMIMLSTADAGIDDGVTKLMQAAKLPGITRVAPVTLRLVFAR